MSTRVRWLGHACLLFESDGRHVLVDPFLTGNPAAASKADQVPADFILVPGLCIARRAGSTNRRRLRPYFSFRAQAEAAP